MVVWLSWGFNICCLIVYIFCLDGYWRVVVAGCYMFPPVILRAENKFSNKLLVDGLPSLFWNPNKLIRCSDGLPDNFGGQK